jgi:signal transduction histidine kinase
MWLLRMPRPFVSAPSNGAGARRAALADAALALAEAGGDPALDHILRITVEAAVRITGAGAAVALADADGALQRFVGHGIDAGVQDALTRSKALRALLSALRAGGRPVGPDDLDPAVGRTLRAAAPHGFLAVPVDAGACLVLAPRTPGTAIDDDAVGLAGTLARHAHAALENALALVSLRASCEELRQLSTQLVVRQDDVLGRTAYELHEGICQRLAAANAQLEALGTMIADQRAARGRLRDARLLVGQAVGELRELSQRLRPPVLDLGYVAAVRWYLNRLRDQSGVALSLEVHGAETRLPSEMESALYRATEEALGAAAEARVPCALSVCYRREPEAIRVEIAGTPPEKVDLVAIRERLRPFGGAVHVTAAVPPVIEVYVPARTA